MTPPEYPGGYSGKYQEEYAECQGNRARLIAATIHLLATQGYEQTSVQDILDEARVTKSNFYYHFKSKENLCLEALSAMEEQFFQNVVVPTLHNEALSPKARLEALFQLTVQKVEHAACMHGCPFNNLASQSSNFSPLLQDQLSRFYARKTRAVQQCYQEGMQAGEFRQDIRPEDAAHIILAMVAGTLTLTKTRQNIDILKQNFQNLLLLLRV